MASLSALIDQHLKLYKEQEKEDFDRARRYYRGDFWSVAESTGIGGLESWMFAQKNLIYAITDSAISSLLGPNPQVAANAETPESQQFVGAVNGLMKWSFKATNMRRRAALSLMDAVLCKRGIFKVVWDAKNDRPVVGNPNPASVFFDLSARDPDDIRYWLEATPLTAAQYAGRVKSGRYKHHEDIKPTQFPDWMLDDGQKATVGQFGIHDKRITVWEFYDLESNTVIHYHKETGHTLFKGKIDYIPYCMYSLNHSGVDCRGLSEVQLVLDQQANINQLLTLWKRVVYLQVPKILYDAGKISSDDLDKAMDAVLGSFVPVEAEGVDELRNFGALFYEMPRPEVPRSVIEFIQRLEADAAFQSALADAARGQVTGAKTATEMAIIDAQMQTRLGTRKSHLNRAIEEVAAKMFYLNQRFMKTPKMIRISGGVDFQKIGIQELHDLQIDFEMVSYNPMRQNPGVMIETLQRLLPILAQAPNINMFTLFEELVSGLGLPQNLIVPENVARQGMAAAQAQQQQVELQRSQGGAAAKKQPPTQEGQTPHRRRGNGEPWHSLYTT